MAMSAGNLDRNERREWKQKEMRHARPMGRGAVAMMVAVPLILGVLAGAVAGVMTAPLTASGTSGSTVDYVNLTVGFDFATGLDRYFPANFTVPAHATVVITITNFDNGTNVVPASMASVQGTVGGTETIRTTSDPQGTVVTSLPPTGIAHTFTLMGGGYALNVVIPPAKSASEPVSVTFTAVFNTAGVFQWHCMAPCDDAAMLTPGFMTGFVTVAGN